MKFINFVFITAFIACTFAYPVGHISLMKRAILSTQTIVSNSETLVQVIDAVVATEVVVTSVVNTLTVTSVEIPSATDNTASATDDTASRASKIDNIAKAIESIKLDHPPSKNEEAYGGMLGFRHMALRFKQ